MGKREQNERKYEQWITKDDGGRIYVYEVKGKSGWFAKYIKEVDSSETTISFRQEILNNLGELVEIHEKYPIHKGHKKIV